jgi:hypothetical protein
MKSGTCVLLGNKKVHLTRYLALQMKGQVEKKRKATNVENEWPKPKNERPC